MRLAAPSAVPPLHQSKGNKNSQVAAFYRGHKLYNQHVHDTAMLLSMDIDDELHS